jgi:hypothetical protein
MLEGLSFVHLLLIVVVAAEFALPVVVIVLVVRYVQGRNRPDPRAILAERLARGEITVDEFHAAMSAIAQPPASSSWGEGWTTPRPGASADAEPTRPPEPPAPGR